MSGIGQAKNSWNRLFVRIDDAMHSRPLLEAVGQAGVADSEENFERQSSPDGRPWPSLRLNTKMAKVARGKSKMGIVTGRLLRSITYRVLGSIVAVGTNLLYGYWFHKGTKPHVIKAKKGKALRFAVAESFVHSARGWRQGRGNWVFRKKVNHPGQAARPFIGIGPRLARTLRGILLGDRLFNAVRKEGP